MHMSEDDPAAFHTTAETSHALALLVSIHTQPTPTLTHPSTDNDSVKATCRPAHETRSSTTSTRPAFWEFAEHSSVGFRANRRSRWSSLLP